MVVAITIAITITIASVIAIAIIIVMASRYGQVSLPVKNGRSHTGIINHGLDFINGICIFGQR
ncbi:hypothetical protein MTY_2693 [Moorella thermoacetica Y72]|uniref:Uncharacterized protein n=1 Tax=Moorella thermoacetica Y72 TaxID=1325331 RepID=A0A0S6UH58_NEOTH|nr:hypothetical protein MTY_2693 [Moorella thermoacetica Y72]